MNTSSLLSALAQPYGCRQGLQDTIGHDWTVPTRQLTTSWPADDAVQAVWAGHACCLVQLDGVTFLTDPALSERVSGVQVCDTTSYVVSLAAGTLTTMCALHRCTGPAAEANWQHWLSNP